MKDSLTICLPLYGREELTLRFLDHANKIRLPYNIIISDGKPSQFTQSLADSYRFPCIRYRYLKFNDISPQAYIEKICTSLSQVDTRYVALADNDDFLVPTGIEKCINFLDANPEFVACGGRISRFHLSDRRGNTYTAHGKCSFFDVRFANSLFTDKNESSSATERIESILASYNPIYYHIYRTKALLSAFEDLRSIALSDFVVQEIFVATRIASLGPVKTDPQIIHYCRQIGTSLQAGTNGMDWFNHLLHSNLPSDYRKAFNKLASTLTTYTEAEKCAFVNRLLIHTARNIKNKLVNKDFLVYPRTGLYYLNTLLRSCMKITMCKMPYQLAPVHAALTLDQVTVSEYIDDFKLILDTLTHLHPRDSSSIAN